MPHREEYVLREGSRVMMAPRKRSTPLASETDHPATKQAKSDDDDDDDVSESAKDL